MSKDALLLRQAIVFISAFVYWAGVAIQARRIRRHIGRSPNVKPRGTREKLLWIGWTIVVLAWMTQPFVVGRDVIPGLRIYAGLSYKLALVAGGLLVLTGYAGTLWCYAAMGDAWRIGINRKEKNALVRHGPYRQVRHPIYLFQMMMLAGAACLLPTVLSLVILVVHLACVWIKARDEEIYLLGVHGQSYGDYLEQTGRLLPKGRRRAKS
jgi:protein-S-isoprenylcysteine O-methyltransferase Ste14